jgi:hypothetical protein
MNKTIIGSELNVGDIVLDGSIITHQYAKVMMLLLKDHKVLEWDKYFSILIVRKRDAINYQQFCMAITSWRNHNRPTMTIKLLDNIEIEMTDGVGECVKQ